MSSARGSFWVLVAAALLLAACLPAVQVEQGSTMEPSAIRYLALGDSYTIGEKVDEQERWPVQLAGRLRAAGITVEGPELIAQTGWTTDELQAAMEQAGPLGPYDLVSLLIGVNNQYRAGDPEVYRGEFRELLAWAIELAGEDPGRVVVLSIPDWGSTPFGRAGDRDQIAAEIDQFNAINRAETGRAGARYVDITGESRRAPDDRTLVARDGLHPSGKAYLAWVELAWPEVLAALDIETREGHGWKRR